MRTVLLLQIFCMTVGKVYVYTIEIPDVHSAVQLIVILLTDRHNTCLRIIVAVEFRKPILWVGCFVQKGNYFLSLSYNLENYETHICSKKMKSYGNVLIYFLISAMHFFSVDSHLRGWSANT